MSSDVRSAAVAGSFYAADPETLRRTVQSLLGRAPVVAADARPPKAIIAPHAGYRCSGAIAATAYATLAPARGLVRRVVIAGPAHFTPVDAVAVSGATAFSTPLGPVTVDDDARRRALEVPGVVVSDAAHAGEHSVEVHLPLLMAVLGDVPILPLVIGRSGAAVLGDVLDLLWGGSETAIVISTDLSHYLESHVASELDRRTAEAICRLEAPAPDAACGAAAVDGLLRAARLRDVEVRALDVRNSADTCSDPERVVGYGAFTVFEV